MKGKFDWILFFRGLSLFVGTVIGAGVFSLPYVFSRSGLGWTIIGSLTLTLTTLVINLCYSRIVLATKKDHQLPGYANLYLGSRAGKLAFLAVTFSSLGALVAYLILGGNFLALLFGQQYSFWHSLLFWGWGVVIFGKGIKAIAKAEDWLTIWLVLILLAVPLLGSRFIQPQSYKVYLAQPFAFYGPLLFALAGTQIIPEVEETVRRKRKMLPLIITVGTLLPALIYLFFGLGVWGISGAATTTDAFAGLWAWSPFLVRIGSLAGFLATFTSFISISQVIKELLQRDYGVKAKLAQGLVAAGVLPACFLPLASFLSIISLTGALLVGGTDFLVLLIFGQNFSRRKSVKLILILTGIVLVGGMVSELWSMIK